MATLAGGLEMGFFWLCRRLTTTQVKATAAQDHGRQWKLLRATFGTRTCLLRVESQAGLRLVHRLLARFSGSHCSQFDVPLSGQIMQLPIGYSTFVATTPV